MTRSQGLLFDIKNGLRVAGSVDHKKSKTKQKSILSKQSDLYKSNLGWKS